MSQCDGQSRMMVENSLGISKSENQVNFVWINNRDYFFDPQNIIERNAISKVNSDGFNTEQGSASQCIPDSRPEKQQGDPSMIIQSFQGQFQQAKQSRKRKIKKTGGKNRNFIKSFINYFLQHGLEYLVAHPDDPDDILLKKQIQNFLEKEKRGLYYLNDENKKVKNKNANHGLDSLKKIFCQPPFEDRSNASLMIRKCANAFLRQKAAKLVLSRRNKKDAQNYLRNVKIMGLRCISPILMQRNQ